MSVKITYIGHSAFIINHENSSIIIDPFITQNPKAAIKISDVKVQDILVTHGHFDHLGDAIEISKNEEVPITAISELAGYCARKGAKVQKINIGGKILFDWGYAYWFPAAHSNSSPNGEYVGPPSSILINIGDVSIYHAGDTGLHTDLKMIGEFYKPDICLLPIDGRYNMGIDEAVQAVKWLECFKVIPMHYDTFPEIKTDVAKFKEAVESQSSAKCIILKPGEIYSN